MFQSGSKRPRTRTANILKSKIMPREKGSKPKVNEGQHFEKYPKNKSKPVPTKDAGGKKEGK